MEIKQIINLTPHEVKFHGERGITQYPPDGTVARVGMSAQAEWSVWVGAGEKRFKTRPAPKGTINLPAPIEGVFYIVSSMVREANPSRLDLLSPTDLIRDEKGVTIGCKSFDTNYLTAPVEYGGHGI